MTGRARRGSKPAHGPMVPPPWTRCKNTHTTRTHSRNRKCEAIRFPYNPALWPHCVYRDERQGRGLIMICPSPPKTQTPAPLRPAHRSAPHAQHDGGHTLWRGTTLPHPAAGWPRRVRVGLNAGLPPAWQNAPVWTGCWFPACSPRHGPAECVQPYLQSRSRLPAGADRLRKYWK